jgi:organic radical activating enzyme
MHNTEVPVGQGLKVFDIRWETDTAGPSPHDNKRVEVFLLGCKRAMEGDACNGCFNSSTWDASKAEFEHDPIKMADNIAEMTELRYITIGGGEPTDQIEHLIPFVKRLKEHGFHIMMYTWRDYSKEIDGHAVVYEMGTPNKDDLQAQLRRLPCYVDILVDGEFRQDECLYQENLGDGMLSSIGSGNQIIWDFKEWRYAPPLPCPRYPMRDLVGLYIKPDTNDLVYITKE